MKKDMLLRSKGQVVRIRPIAKRLNGQEVLQEIDDDWRIIDVDPNKKTIEILNIRCHHQPILGFDHVYSFDPDPMRDVDGQKHGFLQLLVQVYLTEKGPKIEPLPPGYRSSLAGK